MLNQYELIAKEHQKDLLREAGRHHRFGAGLGIGLRRWKSVGVASRRVCPVSRPDVRDRRGLGTQARCR